MIDPLTDMTRQVLVKHYHMKDSYMIQLCHDLAVTPLTPMTAFVYGCLLLPTGWQIPNADKAVKVSQLETPLVIFPIIAQIFHTLLNVSEHTSARYKNTRFLLFC